MSAVESEVGATDIARGVVLAVDGESILVDVDGRDPIACELLERGGTPRLILAEGDSVLVWMGPEEGRGVVLGRIGPSSTPVPDELVIESGRRRSSRDFS